MVESWLSHGQGRECAWLNTRVDTCAVPRALLVDFDRRMSGLIPSGKRDGARDRNTACVLGREADVCFECHTPLVTYGFRTP